MSTTTLQRLTNTSLFKSQSRQGMPLPTPSNRKIRLAVAAFFFMQGICFSSWASRIPDIKSFLHLSEAAMGSILLALPAGQLTAMPFSGRIVTRYGSHKTVVIGLILYSLALINIGLAAHVWQLALGLYLFGIAGNLANISVNTQAIGVEKLYGKPIMVSFHGAWSLAGFTGGMIGSVFVARHIAPWIHFSSMALGIYVVIFLLYKNLYVYKTATTDKPVKKAFFSKPDTELIQLGAIAFCSMASEGAMFDWSGVYFQKVVQAPASWVTLGFTAFMCTMASGRFAGDWLTHHLGRKKLLQYSGVFIAAGLLLAVALPHIVTATIGFLIVGFGVSSVVPTVYSAAGRSTKVSPSMALASAISV